MIQMILINRVKNVIYFLILNIILDAKDWLYKETALTLIFKLTMTALK